MSYVQFTTEKDSGWARVSTRSRASASRQGQSTSMEKRSYKGPLNWLPDRCCRMEGLVLAASPSFLQTTCEEAHCVNWRAHPNPTLGSQIPTALPPCKIAHVSRATKLRTQEGRDAHHHCEAWHPKQATARCELIFSDVQWGP